MISSCVLPEVFGALSLGHEGDGIDKAQGHWVKIAVLSDDERQLVIQATRQQLGLAFFSTALSKKVIISKRKKAVSWQWLL